VPVIVALGEVLIHAGFGTAFAPNLEAKVMTIIAGHDLPANG
jgi:hypothetical protein